MTTSPRTQLEFTSSRNAKNLFTQKVIFATALIFTSGGILQAAEGTPSKAAPKAVAVKGDSAQPVSDSTPIHGTVLESIDAANYTYLRLKTKDLGEVWVAIPQMAVKLKSEVTLRKPIPMFGFESKTLKRKFDKMYFGMLAEQADMIDPSEMKGHWMPGSAPMAKPAADSAYGAMGAGGHPGADSKTPELKLNELKVKKASGKNATTVAELFAKKKDFSAKTVVIRGKVTKYNPDILGKNWIHISDGTGSLKDKNFDVTVISGDKTKIGDVILVTGKVALDKKLDPYFFPIAIEDASLTEINAK